MTIDIPDNLEVFIEAGSKFSVSYEAEVVIIALEQARVIVEGAMQKIKEQLGKDMEAQRLATIKGDFVSVSYREYGVKYIVESPEHMPEGTIERETKWKPISEAIDKFAIEHGALPLGVVKSLRKKTVSVKIKEQL